MGARCTQAVSPAGRALRGSRITFWRARACLIAFSSTLPRAALHAAAPVPAPPPSEATCALRIHGLLPSAGRATPRRALSSLSSRPSAPPPHLLVSALTTSRPPRSRTRSRLRPSRQTLTTSPSSAPLDRLHSRLHQHVTRCADRPLLTDRDVVSMVHSTPRGELLLMRCLLLLLPGATTACSVSQLRASCSARPVADQAHRP